jgi:hypothetical protein
VQTPVQPPPAQTYEHDAGDPQTPPEVHVSTPLPEHCVAPGVHDPAHDPLLQTYWHADPELCHVPVESQVWGCRPLHWEAPGVQLPLQVPVAPLHRYGQLAPLACQLPVVSQTWGCSPLHSLAPGVQLPVHAPFMHAWLLQVAALPHAPAELHVCTPLPEHCVEPGVQLPVQAPLTHAWLVQVAALPHAPAELHVCTPLPEHCVAPGVHATHAPFRHTGAPPAHPVALPHSPFGPQVCTSVLSEHCVAPGTHEPPHAPLAQT